MGRSTRGSKRLKIGPRREYHMERGHVQNEKQSVVFDTMLKSISSWHITSKGQEKPQLSGKPEASSKKDGIEGSNDGLNTTQNAWQDVGVERIRH